MNQRFISNTTWNRLPKATLVCLMVWALFGAFGMRQVISGISAISAYYHSSELARRDATWSPVYGFGYQCAPHMPTNTSVLLIDPTVSSLSGTAGNSGAPSPIDSPNTVAFMYAVYPRSVTTDAGPFSTLRTDQISQDYVAVWRQRSSRSASAHTEAAAVTQRLSMNGLAIQVCSYGDSMGDSGILYAMSTRARTAPGVLSIAALQPPASLTVSALARGILGLICLWCIGVVILIALGAAKIRAPLVVTLGLPIGCIAVSIEMLSASLFGISWSLTLLCVPWLVLAVVLLTAMRARLVVFTRSIYLRWSPMVRMPPKLDRNVAANIVLIALAIIIVGITAYNLPFSDGFNFYYFKAKAFYLDHSVAPYYYHAHHTQDVLFTIPAHPPMLPLSITWLYLWIGTVNEHVSLLLWPALYLSALGLFFAVIRENTNNGIASWLTLALVVCAFPFTASASGGGFTDMPLGVFLLMGCALLWRRLSHPTPNRELIVASIMLGALPLIKEEGLPMSIAVLVTFLFLFWWKGEGGRNLRAVAHVACWLGLPWLLTLLPSLLVRLIYAPPELLIRQGDLPIRGLLSGFLTALVGFSERAAYYWLPVVLLLAAVPVMSLIGRRSQPKLPIRAWFLLAIVCIQCMLDVVAMAVNPVEVQLEVRVTAVRLILQLTPLLMLASLDLWLVLTEMSMTKRQAAYPRVSNAGP